MKISGQQSDDTILEEIGRRLAALRIALNLTQAQLAEKAGVSKRTVERLETGTSATQLTAFVRICRALDVIDSLNTVLPEAEPEPMVLLRRKGRPRQRVRSSQSSSAEQKPWSWGEES